MHCKTITRAKAEHGRWNKFQFVKQLDKLEFGGASLYG